MYLIASLLEISTDFSGGAHRCASQSDADWRMSGGRNEGL
jgi:hypothetical protein